MFKLNSNIYQPQYPWIGRFIYHDAVFNIDWGINKTVYLTFDDGPNPETTPVILDILKNHNAKGTFFCVGNNVEKYPNIFQQIRQEGHTIGNHTYWHLKGWDTPVDEYMEDIRKCAGIVPSNLFRPPYGSMTPKQYRLLKDKYTIVLWDVLIADYDSSFSAKQCIDIVKSNVKRGSIIVFHDNLKAKDKISEVLPAAIEFITSAGYELQPMRVLSYKPNKE
jgi:peptidoglycan-N-acetylglucosamine deacetylase